MTTGDMLGLYKLERCREKRGKERGKGVSLDGAGCSWALLGYVFPRVQDFV
jgi:hypothetical protein